MTLIMILRKLAFWRGSTVGHDCAYQYHAGVHSLLVLVDKPVTETAEQARELYRLAQSKGLVLYAYQNRRWDSDFLALKKLLSLPETDARSLGKILEFESQYVTYPGVISVWQPAPQL